MTNAPPASERQALLAAIGRALWRDTPYEEGDGPFEDLPARRRRTVLGGAVEPRSGRVAWVEQLVDDPQGEYVPVRFDIHVAGGGSSHTYVQAPTYNPYFGCTVTHVGWWGESLVVLYEEKHLALVARMNPPYDGTLDLVRLGEPYALEGDTVYFASRHSGLLEGVLLPSLASALPLPVPDTQRLMRLEARPPGRLALVPRVSDGSNEPGGTWSERLEAARAAAPTFPLAPFGARAFVESPQRLWPKLAALLAPTAPPVLGVDVLVGSVATRFWRDETPRGKTYEDVYGFKDTLGFLAVYWYRHLVAERRSKEAQAWLNWLERVASLAASEPWPWTQGLEADERVARTALAYLRARAATLAEVCRTGKLPEGEHCYLFHPPSRAEPFRRDEAYPSGVREVLRQVAAHNPLSLSKL
ncbi:MAG TPA: hypothetical protein VF815_24530 [Myxococcaceae bacterium]